MNDRRLAEPVVAVPTRRLGQSEVDLHLRAAETKPFSRFGNIGRHIGGIEQSSIQLRGRDVADDGTLGFDGLTSGELHPGRAAAGYANSLHIAPGLAHTTVVSDQAS